MENEAQNYVTKEEFCKICGISLSTGYKLLKMHKIQFEKCREGLRQYYKIPISEIDKYNAEKEKLYNLYLKEKGRIEEYYETKLEGYPNLITAKDVRDITGYGKEAVRNWIKKGYLLGGVTRGSFRIAKCDLYEYLTSYNYYKIKRKCKKHLDDLKNI